MNIAPSAWIKKGKIWIYWPSSEWQEVWKKISPIFRNVAKTIAKLQKLKLKVETSCIKMLLNVKISTTNCILKLLIWVKLKKNTQVKSSQMLKIRPIWSPWPSWTWTLGRWSRARAPTRSWWRRRPWRWCDAARRDETRSAWRRVTKSNAATPWRKSRVTNGLGTILQNFFARNLWFLVIRKCLSLASVFSQI